MTATKINANRSSARYGLEDLRSLVASMMDMEPDDIDNSESLIDLGLDSVNMMRIPVILKGYGYRITARELLNEPNIGAWWRVLQANFDANPASQEEVVKKFDVRRGTRFPLTPIQQAYLVGRRTDQILGGNACHLYCEFDGREVVPKKLEEAVHALCRHHPMLRAKFFDDGFQQVLPESPWRSLDVHDLREFDAAEVKRRLLQIRDSNSHRKLDVFSGQVFDISLSQLPNGASRLHFNIDLLIADVLSITIFLRDLASLYGGETLATPIDFDFQDYLAQQNQTRYEEVAQAESYWSDRLPTFPSQPSLPINKTPSSASTPQFIRREFRLPITAVECMRQEATKRGLTLAAAFASAYSMVLARWSENAHFLLNVPLFDRAEINPVVANMIADFTNLVLVEIDAREATTFLAHAKAVQQTMHRDIGYAAYSGIEVLRTLRRARIESAAPIVLACNFSEPLLSDQFERSLGQLGWSISQTPQVWLDHQIYRLNDHYLLNWDAVEALFPPDTLDSMFDAYEAIVRQLCEGNWEEISFPGIPPAQAAIRDRINATDAPVDSRLLHEPFLAQVKLTPKAIALITSSEQITYEELHQKAGAFAGILREAGISGGDRVAVILPKGSEQIIAVLGTLMAGGVYVPVAADSPPERLASIVRDADCRFGIRRPSEDCLEGRTSSVLWLDPVVLADPRPTQIDAPTTHRQSQDLAYLIYTSGSTGTPKGVMIDHRGALNTILDINRRWSLSPSDRILCLSSLAFDLSVYDIFGALSCGAALIVPDEAGRRDPAHWLSIGEEFGITVWNSVPALMTMAVDYAERRGVHLPASLRLVLLSGDWIPLSLADRVRQISTAKDIVGLGGATEASIWSNWFQIDTVEPGWTSIPYGFPLTNQQYHVLDAKGRNCPDWVPGDLYIAGTGLAHGYWNDPQKTQHSFVRGLNGERLYRTGDRARYWPDGTLEFLGRLDFQVKINGHRVELGEIDTAMARIYGISQAISDVRSFAGQRQVVSFVTLDKEIGDIPAFDRKETSGQIRLLQNIEAGDLEFPHVLPVDGDLREQLAKMLPDHMIPRIVAILDAFPLSSNGKVDRSHLPEIIAPTRASSTDAAEEDTTALMRTIASLWSASLNCEGISGVSNFFDLGGDSLLAIRMTSDLSQHLGIEISVRHLYEHPELEAFVDAVSHELATEEAAQ